MRDADGEPVESIASLSGLSQTRPGFAAGASRSSCSASPASRRCSASGPSCWCSTPRSASGYVALAVAGIVGTVIGAYYYLKIVKVMYFDEPARALRAASAQPIQGAADPARRDRRVAARLSADRPARRAHRPRRGGAFLTPHPRSSSAPARPMPTCLPTPAAVEGDWLVAPSPGQRAGAGRAGLGVGAGQFLRQHRWSQLRPDDPPAPTPVAGRRRWR